ncbi:MAG: hypothetical protein HC890_09065 [Chloroflexaceae bacterium]|nr:hypothetical protein [Chloroflexaceae bacterium]
MRRRRSRQTLHPEQNLDSFLDILTNTVGVLMFVGLFVALVTAEAGTIVRTPLVAASQKLPRFFELRRNQLFHIDIQGANQKIDAAIAALPQCHQPNVPDTFGNYFYEEYREEIAAFNDCVVGKIAKLKNIQIETAAYRVNVLDFDAIGYQLKEAVPGEAIADLTQAESGYSRLLADLNPQTDYLAFLVRPDSFAVFRQARKVAWQQGFEVGWEPFERDGEIIFGTNGRSVGVQ